MFAPIATVSRRTTTFGGYRRDTETATTERRSIAIGGVRLVEALHEWRAPDRILVVQIGVNANEAKVYKAHTTPLGLCDNLINALMLLWNKQKDGGSPNQKYCDRPARKKQKRHHGRAEKIHQSG